MTTEKVTAYKGFDQDFKCRDMQYAVGETFTHDGEVSPCKSGLHACEYPLDVFRYYPPAGARFAEVEASGTIIKHESYSKLAASALSIKVELSLAGIIKAAIDYTFRRALPADPKTPASATGYQGAASATGYQGAASATGYQGAASATGYQGAASATGDQGAASATGDQGAASATGIRGAASATGYQGAASATGIRGAAMASGFEGRAKGALGNALFLVYRDPSGGIKHAWAGIVGKAGVKEDTWYTLNSRGKPKVWKP